jgi:hypothetical protein
MSALVQTIGDKLTDDSLGNASFLGSLCLDFWKLPFLNLLYLRRLVMLIRR